MAYAIVLVAKILLAVYAFIVAWLLPRRRDRPAGGIGGAVTGPVALTIAGVLVIGLPTCSPGYSSVGWGLNRNGQGTV